MPPRGKGLLVAILVATVTSGAAGCGNSEATKTESQSFPLPGEVLRIDASEAAVKVVSGTGESVDVQRELKGKATDDGNSTWTMSGDTLKLGLRCSGIVISCEGRYTVAVPQGTALRVNASGSAVTLDSLTGDIDASVTHDGTLRVAGPTGKLSLATRGGSITVTNARSTEVTAETKGDGNIDLDFLKAPERVKATASGSVQVTLPNDSGTYRIVGADSASLASDDKSSRSITVSAAEGTASVQRAG